MRHKADKLQSPKMSTMNPMKKIKSVAVVRPYQTRKSKAKSPIIETFDINNLDNLTVDPPQVSVRSNASPRDL